MFTAPSGTQTLRIAGFHDDNVGGAPMAPVDDVTAKGAIVEGGRFLRPPQAAASTSARTLGVCFASVEVADNSPWCHCMVIEAGKRVLVVCAQWKRGHSVHRNFHDYVAALTVEFEVCCVCVCCVCVFVCFSPGVF